MATLQHRGRCRLMLRIPGWRAEFRDATDPDFLDICEAYELAWRGLMVTGDTDTAKVVVGYSEMVDCLETVALTLAVLIRNRRTM